MTERDDEALFSTVNLTVPERETPSDNEAPYGYKPDGTPYKRRPNANAGNRTGRARKKNDSEKAVADAVSTIYGALAGLLALFARLFQSVPLMADSIVMNKAAPKTIPPLIKVVGNNDKLTELCVRLSQITPGVELATQLLPLIGAMIANHGLVPGAEGQAEKIVRRYQKENETKDKAEKEADESWNSQED